MRFIPVQLGATPKVGLDLFYPMATSGQSRRPPNARRKMTGEAAVMLIDEAEARAEKAQAEAERVKTRADRKVEKAERRCDMTAFMIFDLIREVREFETKMSRAMEEGASVVPMLKNELGRLSGRAEEIDKDLRRSH